MATCINPNCNSRPGENRRVLARGLCRNCYMRAWNRGKVEDWAKQAAPHVYGPQTPAWQRTVAYEQRRAAEWLAARERVAA